MKKSIVIMVACALLAFAFIALSGERAKDAQDKPAASGLVRAQYAPNKILVKFKDDPEGMMAESGRVQAEYEFGLKQLKYFKRINVHVYETERSVEATLKDLLKNPNIAYAEPDYIVHAGINIPNDPSFTSLWGMNNTGQTGGTVDADIDAPEAWDLTTGSPDVIVGVIDTGVAYNHVDLAANMWVNPGEIAANGIDDDGNGYVDDVHGINAITPSGDPMDDNNHGTHCSGTIAGVGNNGIGVAGVCWTAKIMALKFLGSDGSGDTSDAIPCIEYAINKGAHILSNSWGGGGYSQALKDAIDDAGAAGLLFVAAANNYKGNNDLVPSYPGSYLSPNIIAVAATDDDDALAVWSSTTGSHWGPYSVDVAAPGTAILSTIPGDSYASYNGTSMATPHVAGLAALIKSYNFSLNWMQIRERILGGAEPKSSLSGLILTGARINAYNSLTMGDVTSYQLDVQSYPATGVPLTVSPADLDGLSSGTTNFTRRYTPYETVTLTAPATHLGMNFGYWTLEGSKYSTALSVTLPVDYTHHLVAFYILPLVEALDNLSLPFVTYGAQSGWLGQMTTSHTGGDAAQSRDAADGQSGSLQTSVLGPGTLTFYWKVSSESNDTLAWYLDGVSQNTISGEVDWTQVSLPVGDGLHVIRWTYSKSSSISGGADCGWVDDVQFGGSPATLGQAVDQQSLVLTTGEYGGWFAQPTTYQYDGDAVQSAKVLDNEQATMSVSVTGPTSLSFYWKVSSESTYDYLRFYIDSVLQNSLTGTVDWTQVNTSLASGAHVLRWAYIKDVSLSSGSDCGWVDHIQVSPAGNYSLSLTKGGEGGGKVKVGSDPIHHDLPYAESFTSGAAVGLQAFPDGTSAFSSWSGDLATTANPTTITMDASKGVVANFNSTLTPSITVTSPNGGESWPRSSAHSITWTRVNLTGTVTIDLYKGGSLRKNLGTAEAAAGTFSWTISTSEPVASDYRIRVWQDSVTDSSDADFSIADVSPFLLQESFSGAMIPTGWAYQNVGNTTAWSVSTTALAGGAANEMLRHWSAGTLTRLVTPPINTTGASSVQLSFKHFYDAYASGITLKVQTSPDATTWTDEGWVVAASGTNIGPETVVAPLVNNINIATTYIGFVVAGSSLALMDNWYIDDVEVTGTLPPSNPTEDLLATWDGQGVFYRNSDTGAWVKLASPGTMIAAGDIDDDGIDDVIGLWPSQGGIWVKCSGDGAWARLSSTAVHIASGDMNGDGRDDLLGTWDGQGVFYRDSATGTWVKMASPATLITTGDIDGDSIDDLIGIWPSQGGIWVKYSTTGAWARLSSTAVDFAAGDMNGDDRDDLLATWVGQGVFYRDSISGSWVKMASEATQVTCGDLDTDGSRDLIGIWPGQGGVWVKYSATGAWARLSSTARDITAGIMRLEGGAGLGIPASGAEGPSLQEAKTDLSDIGPNGRRFAPRVQKNIEPRESTGRAAIGRVPGPGEPGFKAARQQESLIPGQKTALQRDDKRK